MAPPLPHVAVDVHRNTRLFAEGEACDLPATAKVAWDLLETPQQQGQPQGFKVK